MDKPKPKYEYKEQIKIPHMKKQGIVDNITYNESNEQWIYRIYIPHKKQVKLYQEKNLIAEE